jgi:hypothetical protein
VVEAAAHRHDRVIGPHRVMGAKVLLILLKR